MSTMYEFRRKKKEETKIVLGVPALEENENKVHLVKKILRSFVRRIAISA